MEVNERIAAALESIADSFDKFTSVYVTKQRYKEALFDCECDKTAQNPFRDISGNLQEVDIERINNLKQKKAIIDANIIGTCAALDKMNKWF